MVCHVEIIHQNPIYFLIFKKSRAQNHKTNLTHYDPRKTFYFPSHCSLHLASEIIFVFYVFILITWISR